MHSSPITFAVAHTALYQMLHWSTCPIINRLLVEHTKRYKTRKQSIHSVSDTISWQGRWGFDYLHLLPHIYILHSLIVTLTGTKHLLWLP